MKMKLPMQKKAHDVCPQCGSISNDNYRTEKFSDTYIVRYHKCECGFRFKTEDIVPR